MVGTLGGGEGLSQLSSARRLLERLLACVLQELLSPGQLFGKHLDQSKEIQDSSKCRQLSTVNIISHSLSGIDAIEEQHSKIEMIHSRNNLVRLETALFCIFCNINMVKNYNFLKNIIIYGTNSTPLLFTLSKYRMIDTITVLHSYFDISLLQWQYTVELNLNRQINLSHLRHISLI